MLDMLAGETREQYSAFIFWLSHEQNITETAKMADISRDTCYKWRKTFNWLKRGRQVASIVKRELKSSMITSFANMIRDNLDIASDIKDIISEKLIKMKREAGEVEAKDILDLTRAFRFIAQVETSLYDRYPAEKGEGERKELLMAFEKGAKPETISMGRELESGDYESEISN